MELIAITAFVMAATAIAVYIKIGYDYKKIKRLQDVKVEVVKAGINRKEIIRQNDGRENVL